MNPPRDTEPRSSTRETNRYPHLREISLTYEGRSEHIAVRPPDISPRGMFINTANHFPEGAVLKLRFRLTDTNFEVETRCEVRYCLPGVGIGVEFVGIAPEAVRAIEREIRSVPRSVGPGV
ncbi:MAG: PilZ domain-containing protein [Acidobacteria bacterium]|nr:PilZ domain-containing protein [Acidobacteriota bacterium]